jgi:oligoendopeptidase F
MLAAGGSQGPVELVAMVGLDVTDPGFWNTGLDLLDGMLNDAEARAETL